MVETINRKNTFGGEMRESFEKLQTTAAIVVHLFGVVLLVDTVKGVNEFLGMVRILL